MPFYKVPATSSGGVSSGSAPFAIKHQSPNYISNNITGQSSMATGVDDVTWGDSSDRSVGSGGVGGGGNLAELTEADRDSELLRRDLEQRVQLSQVERKKMDHANGNVELFSSGSNHRRTNDIIEEELMAQHRRETELASTRQCVVSHQQNQSTGEDYGSEFPSQANYGPVASDYAHPGESRIVQELMEQRRRELELRGRWKEMGLNVPDEMNDNETPFTLPEPRPVPHRTAAAARRDERDHVDAAAAASPRRESSENGGMKVRPYEDPDSTSERKLAYTPANETPIEREIRRASEREDALRQARGLLPLGVDQQGRDAMNVEIEVTSPNGNYYQGVTDPSGVKVSMKKLANNRLQLELLKEKEREVALRSQGAIHTISEERAGEPVKYVEIISKQLSDSPSPIPFKCPPDGTMYSPEAKQMVVVAGMNNHTVDGRQVVVEVKAPEATVVNGRARHSIAGQCVEQVNELEAVFGGRLQKHQEPMMLLQQKSSTAKPTAAERKILNELKEMQMREEELKSQRKSVTLSSSPFDAFDANSSIVD